jgi:foldase protein PrsA
MTDLDTVIASTQGVGLTLREFLYSLKLQLQLPELLEKALQEKLVLERARTEEVAATDEELQQAADAFRQANQLFRAEETEQWLAEHFLTLKDFETRLERDVIRRKLANKVVPPHHIERHFAETRTEHDRAKLSHLLVEREGVAAELLSQIQDEGSDFADLARKYSIDAGSRGAGGSLGVVERKSLPPAVESAVFTARGGDLVGPVKSEHGYHLIRVEEIHLGTLNEETAERVREELFAEWLTQQVTPGETTVPLLEEL